VSVRHFSPTFFKERFPQRAERARKPDDEKGRSDMSEDSYIEVDGEVVQRNGTFVFEDGFEE